MRDAIRLLRSNADICERQAKAAKQSSIRAELFDITAQWHYLAGEAEKLYDREVEIRAGLRADDGVAAIR